MAERIPKSSGKGVQGERPIHRGETGDKGDFRYGLPYEKQKKRGGTISTSKNKHTRGEWCDRLLGQGEKDRGPD